MAGVRVPVVQGATAGRIREQDLGAVAEAGAGARQPQARVREHREQGLPAEAAEHDHRPQRGT
jgi:hypothetical protein